MEPQNPAEVPTPPQPSTTITPTVAPTELSAAAPTASELLASPAEPAPAISEQPQAPPPQPVPLPAQPPAAPPSARPTAPAEQAAKSKERVPNILPVTEPGERTICVIKRHRIGIMSVYVMCGLVVLITAVLAFLITPEVSGSRGNDRGQTLVIGTLIFLVVTVICAAFAMISAKVYWGNSWTVTTDSLTQVRRFGLFSRQSSQLSLKDLEDVTAQQSGVLAEMFNFGLLKVETAGERSKFMFPFCPNPNYYAQQILKARETFERNRAVEENSYQEVAETPQTQTEPLAGPPASIPVYDTESTP